MAFVTANGIETHDRIEARTGAPRLVCLDSPALTLPYKTSILRSPRQTLPSLPTSHSEETGPVFGHDILDPHDDDLIRFDIRRQGEAETVFLDM